MTDDQIRSDMEALMTRLVQTEGAMMDTRRQIAAAPKAAAPLVDTRTIGKAPTFTGENKDWPESSFQFTAYMGSANPKSTEALRWAAMTDGKITAATVVQQSFEEHNAQLSGLGTAVQGTCIGNSEQQQRRAPTSTDAVLVTAETCRVDSAGD